MDTKLWEAVQDFKLDHPNEEYGFSTRLAYENNWTLFFTQKAILEYKKFMYLAATANEMVSPSEIVDIVWHQHLIFTNSYTDLCKLLSKKIEHIPSTHNRSEKEKFLKAKQRTKELYERNFGNQPKEIWEYHDELSSLPLNKSRFAPSRVSKIFIIVTLVSLIPFYFLLKPILVSIGNPDFLIYYVFTSGVTIAALDAFIKRRFDALLCGIETNLIISNLSAFELVFFQKNKIEHITHGVLNNLIANQKVKVLKNNRLNLLDETPTDNPYENCVIEIMSEYEPMPYPQLSKLILKKPLFEQLENSVTRIKEHILNSKEFQSVFLIAMSVLALLMSIGISRLILGISRDKPIAFLLIFTVLLWWVSYFYARRMENYFFTHTLPNSYKTKIINRKEENSWEWNYFLVGPAILIASFIPLTNYINRNSNRSGSCGTGCGSSCGSSCGGGGSCGGGCGGCGGGD